MGRLEAVFIRARDCSRDTSSVVAGLSAIAVNVVVAIGAGLALLTSVVALVTKRSAASTRLCRGIGNAAAVLVTDLLSIAEQTIVGASAGRIASIRNEVVLPRIGSSRCSAVGPARRSAIGLIFIVSPITVGVRRWVRRVSIRAAQANVCNGGGAIADAIVIAVGVDRA